jgi:pimeloyl-ACP methyl ester carboxylesterase
VHGIIGDTEGMTRSGYVSGATPAPRLIGSAYDLVLAFDYENLNTTIEENATLLRDLLRDVGLGEGHGKRFDVVAHSMGGLISRQLIEFVGGVEVTRLITLGTPQAGSRLATLQKWGTAAIALALNGLTSVAWPVAALNALLGAIERVDNSLDEMEEGSPLVAKLASAPDPHVPYVVIVGNRSLTAGVPEDTVGRLLTRLSPQHLLGQAADLAFLRQPNDLAVAVTSARALPAGRVPAPVIHEVGCDHVTFFSTSAGLSELAAAALDGR